MRILVAASVLIALLSAPLEAQVSDDARQYLDAVLDIMEEEALRRASVDWVQVRADAHSFARRASTPEQTYPAIRRALRALRDNHSFLQLPQPSQTPSGALMPPSTGVAFSRRVGDDIGLIRVPFFMGADVEAFAAHIDSLIVEVDGPSVCGWIVDLRQNGGGNMWPMLSGLQSILGAPPLGAFRSPTGVGSPWVYTVPSPGTPLHRPDPPVAVLTDRRTASSGEAVAIAFHGRPDTRFFGEPTAGVPTANRSFPLSDGAILFLTVATMLDRDGREYSSSLIPDELVTATAAEEPAARWVRSVCNAAI
ncbi:MAG: S41 family peptidase [Longimicrobiales bacterium]